MELNKIHNINFLDNTLPDKCANLIIADPPYFEVKGAFDFIWSDMKAYLQDVEKWLSYRDWETDRKSTRLNSSHSAKSRMPSSA